MLIVVLHTSAARKGPVQLGVSRTVLGDCFQEHTVLRKLFPGARCFQVQITPNRNSQGGGRLWKLVAEQPKV
jgi:hypothetical protein